MMELVRRFRAGEVWTAMVDEGPGVWSASGGDGWTVVGKEE